MSMGEGCRGARHFWAALVSAAFMASLGLLSGCDVSVSSDSTTKVNGSVHVPAGKPPESASTVNGSIQVDDKAAITSASTVNGSISLGDETTASSLTTVNGSITLGKAAKLSSGATSVNGGISVGEGADVAGTVSNVNGKISVTSAHVGGGIKTVNGGIALSGSTKVEGGIVVEKPSSELFHLGQDLPRIVIGPGVTVQGELRFERKVELYVSDKATIGTVTGATAIPFSGDSPSK